MNTRANGSMPHAGSQKLPVITWPTPAPILNGTALSSVQLNATANVAGTFTYSPSAGTVLAVGLHTLSVTFTPAKPVKSTPNDTSDYLIATAQVDLDVYNNTPLLQWEPPAPIAMNTPLTVDRYKVTAVDPVTLAPIPGVFSFSPPLGTEFSLPVAQELQANFTPADKRYTQAHIKATLLVLPLGIVCWGDSLSGLFHPDPYPRILASLITLPVVSEGVPAQTSTQIGVRQGGVKTTVTPNGGSIPADASVGVVFPAGYEPVIADAPQFGVTGTISKVHGTVTYTSGGILFTREQAGEEVKVPLPVSFLVDTPYKLYLPIFWEGRTNFSYPTQVLRDIAAQVASLADGQDYVVLSILNSDYQTEWKGGKSYQKIVSLNNQLANLYGSHFIDVRKDLVNAYNPDSALDVSDFNHDIVPTSLRLADGWGTLASAIDATTTTLSFNLTKGTAEVGKIMTIDTGSNAENVQIVSISGSTITVVRDMGGASIGHPAGAPVVVTDQLHPNRAGYTIVAKDIAAYLSDYGVSASQSNKDLNERRRQNLHD